jgi:Bacterial Ig domain
MRALLLVALLATPALAERQHPYRPVLVGPMPAQRTAPLAAPSSRIIFMHRCPVQGCPIVAAPFPMDDSRQNKSGIAPANTTIGRFTQSDEVWQKMLSCVRATFAPFDVMVTDVDPGPMTQHYEHIVGGKPTELDPTLTNAGGVAPRTCVEIPNAMTYTFDVYGDDHETLCWTASQEIAHAFGLEHELNAKDPLTYLSGNLPKRFQAADAQCGEGIPRICTCTPSGLQNTYDHILTMFGPGTPTPPSLLVKSPGNGKKVQPGFVTRVNATDDSGMDHVEILVDGVKIADSYKEPFTIKAPDVVAPGPHTLEVKAYDVQGTPASQMLDITMGPPCTASAGCEGDDVCLAGVCTAGPDAPGGLGYACQASTECISGTCIKQGGSVGQCVEQCDPAVAGYCPSGFDCLDAGGGAGVCWLNDSGGGCCSVGGSPTGAILLTTGVLALVLRRRRARGRR